MIEEELQQLIDGCKRQNRQCQKLLYEKLYGFAMNICLRYVGRQSDASEVLNEGFFKALTNIEQYDTNWPFKAWLRKIMYHVSIDHYRAGLKGKHMEELGMADEVKIEAVVEQKLEYEDMLTMIQQLPPAYRMVFNLYAIDGYSHEEIAEMIGISPGTSRSNLYKARKKLQQMLMASPSKNSGTEFRNIKIVSTDSSNIDTLFRINFRRL